MIPAQQSLQPTVNKLPLHQNQLYQQTLHFSFVFCTFLGMELRLKISWSSMMVIVCRLNQSWRRPRKR
uniref:Uncharacterized protein n=1 Tax=Arundo donax TaxID=35708 RepID=A0A0A8ZNQ7_ARUDO